MESYKTLYRIKVTHDYFGSKPCTALQCQLTPQGAELARRRGLLFRQTAADEWLLLFSDAPAKDDVLTFDLSIADPNFALYTEWKDFRPSKAYGLALPQQKKDIDAATAISLSDKKRNIGSGFCTVMLRITQEMIGKTENDEPMEAVLHFTAPSVKWEYLFIPRTETGVELKQLVLEDTTGKIQFAAFKEQTVYERAAIRTASKTRIPMRQSYGCKLRLTAQENGRQKRILLSQIPTPEPGKYLDARKGIARQVCYY